MKASLNLCLLFSLISPVLLLTCNRCTNATGTDCQKTESKKCKVMNPVCRNLIFRSNVFLNNGQVNKYCLNQNICHPGHFSVSTSGGGFLEMLVECCKKDNCNSNTLEFSSEPMKPNGLECVGCKSEVTHQGKCEGTEVVKCLGEQTKCISMTVDYLHQSKRGTSGKTFTAKGCATPQMCDGQKVKYNIHLRTVVILSVTVKCSNALE